MALTVVFRVPRIHERPTGGNLVNRRLIERLRARSDLAVAVHREGEGTSDSRRRDVPDLELVDSLLVTEPGSTSFVPGAPPSGARRVLLAHYLRCVDPSVEESSDARRERETICEFDAVVAPSRYVRDRLIENGLDAGRVFVWTPGLDERYRIGAPRTGSAGRTPVLLTVAGVVPGKGHREVPELAAALEDRDWRWHLVGDPGLDRAFAEKVRSELENTSVAERFRWFGAVDPDAMPARYDAADLFVLPSRFETLSLATREAMARGCPPVAYRVGGLSEVVADGETGLLAPPGDVGGLARRVERLLSDPSLRAACGRRAARAARRWPDWDEAAERFAELLRTISE